MTKQRLAIVAIMTAILLSACTATPQKPNASLTIPDENPVYPINPVRREKIDIRVEVSFAFDEAELRPEEKKRLDEIFGKLRDAHIEFIMAIGHTDQTGHDQYNENLSRDRAHAVRKYLVSILHNLDPDRIGIEGAGKNDSATGKKCVSIPNRKEKIECYQPDRRVTLHIIGFY